MKKLWVAIAMLPLAHGLAFSDSTADETPAATPPGLLAKATGCSQDTRCGGTHLGPIKFGFWRGPSTDFSACFVFRNAEELAARLGGPDHAKDAKVQQQAEAKVAEFLNVKAIDWNKQMIVAVLSNYQVGEPNREIEFAYLRSQGNGVQIGWREAPARKGHEFVDKRFPCVAYGLALLDRHDGAVSFVAERQVIAFAANNATTPSIGPLAFQEKGGHLTVRNAEDLLPGRGCSNTIKQRQVRQEELAKILRVKEINWTRQMVLAIDGGTFTSDEESDALRIEIVSLQVVDKTLTVAWRLRRPLAKRVTAQRPKALVLVDRWDGPVEFREAAAK